MVTALKFVGRQQEARSESTEMSGWLKIARPLLVTSVAVRNSSEVGGGEGFCDQRLQSVGVEWVGARRDDETGRLQPDGDRRPVQIDAGRSGFSEEQRVAAEETGDRNVTPEVLQLALREFGAALDETTDGKGGVECPGACPADGGEAEAAGSDLLQQTVENTPTEGAMGTAALEGEGDGWDLVRHRGAPGQAPFSRRFRWVGGSI